MNYYLLIKKPYLSDQEAVEMTEAYNHIHSLLMANIKSPNIQIQEWASEKIHDLESSNLKTGPYDKIHIGKSKHGERFTFSNVHSCWSEWRSYVLANGSEIVDEYGNNVDLQDLEKSINQSIKCPVNHPKMKLSQDGYYLVKGDFT